METCNFSQDLTEKYLVAATVCYTESNKNIINLRSTTQMPNIRGFGPLMALIFCPTMQVKCNEERTHYTAIRAGLGYDHKKKRAIFEEHDIVFNLDVEITQHDIMLVRTKTITIKLIDLIVCFMKMFDRLTGESDSLRIGHIASNYSGRRKGKRSERR